MLDLVLDTLVKATLVIGATWVASLVWRWGSAARRHLVWALSLGGVLLLPLAEAIGPSWRVLPVRPRTPAVDQVTVATPVATRPAAPIAPVPATLDARRPMKAAALTGSTAVAAPSGADWPLVRLLIALWLVGMGVVLASFAVARVRVARIARRARLVADPEWLGLRDVLAAELDLDRHVTLLVVDSPTMPMTWGIWRPVVLLPAEADAWPEARRHDVLLHELAHVERRDCLTHFAAVLATAVYWFHPLVWVAAQRLRVERERACDDLVLAAGARPSEYAEHLLELANGLRAGASTALASLAMARPSHLATRLLDVLDARRRREPLTRHLALSGAIAAAFVVLPLASLRPGVEVKPEAVRTGRSELPSLIGDEALRPSPHPALASLAVVQHAPAASDPADTGDCRPAKSQSNRSWSSEHNKTTELSITAGGCSVELRANGGFKLNADFTDIGQIDDGGSVTVETKGGVDRRVEVRPRGGKLEHRYFVGNTEHPYDAGATAWFTATLTDLLRRTGFAAQDRSQWILQTRGVDGLFQEIAELDGDYAKRIYYEALIADGKADPAVVSRVVTQAGNEMMSAYDLAELLVLVGRLYPLTEPMRSAFVTASGHLDSDYDRHRVLAVVLANRNLPDDLASAVLTSASGISSDYDLAEVLIVLIQKHPITEGMRAAFFKAVNSIDSDYDRHRVLSTLLAQNPPAAPSLVVDALGSVGKISSAYDRAEVLVQVANSYALAEPMRASFFAAVDGIDSDYDHARVLKTLTDQQKLADPVIAGVIASARKIGSSTDRADVLIALAQHVRLSGDLRHAYVDAAKGIDSDYDRTRALAAIGGSEL
jgi:beta-lactamase regulating signal transducer with metallopeptidase domain